MEKSYYSLKICTKESNYSSVSEILKIRPKDLSNGWIYEVEETDIRFYDFINAFLDILEDKYVELDKVGVSRKDISIWVIYEYEGQCNFEFLPKDLKRLGDNEISLCISCYE